MSRSIAGIVDAIRTVEGGGFTVRRPLPSQKLPHFDPFLLLDHLGPAEYGPGEAVGAPDHPHRGFETVTYLLEGRMVHKDSRGHTGRLGPGDVQWMTAGSGVIHSEMPAEEVMREGGRAHGFQLWVNLPSRDKMIAPRYQDIPAARIPEASEGGVRVRVIAGEALGRKAVIETRTPIFYLHFTLSAGARIVQPAARAFNTFAYVFQGEARVSGQRVVEGQMAVLAADADEVELAGEGDLLLVGGVPLDEPVARYGPFVMNTEEEIWQAIRDFRGGRMGAIDH